MFAHLSVIQYLEDIGAARHLDEIWGASGGAVIGYLYSMGVKPEDMRKEAESLLRGKMNMDMTPSLFSVAKKILVESLPFKDNPTGMGGLHDIQEKLQKWASEITQGREMKLPFYCLAYNLAKNQTDVLTPISLDPSLYPNFIFSADPVEAIVASASVPILFVPKIIDDQHGRRVYADGATGEEVPTVSVYKKWLRDRELGLETRNRLLVISVDLHPELSSLGIFENWLIRKIPAIKYLLMTIELTDLMRKSRIQEQKRQLVNDPNVELWELDFELKGGGLMNPSLIPKVLELSQESIPRQFLKINDSLLG